MSDGPSQQTFPFQEIDQFGVKCIGGDKLTESLYVVSGSIQTEFHSIGDPVSVRIRQTELLGKLVAVPLEVLEKINPKNSVSP